MKNHSSSVSMSSNMLGGEMWNSDTISFPFTSWITRAHKQVPGVFKKTHLVLLGEWEICSCVLNGKSLTPAVWLRGQLQLAVVRMMVATDLQVWAAQCCWLSVSRCTTEALASVGTWVRAPTARKYMMDYFLSKKRQLWFTLI